MEHVVNALWTPTGMALHAQVNVYWINRALRSMPVEQIWTSPAEQIVTDNSQNACQVSTPAELSFDQR